jgi:hypothetical protein
MIRERFPRRDYKLSSSHQPLLSQELALADRREPANSAGRTPIGVVTLEGNPGG